MGPVLHLSSGAESAVEKVLMGQLMGSRRSFLFAHSARVPAGGT